MAIELTDAAFEAALARGREQSLQPFATGVRYDEMDHSLVISFSSGTFVSFDPRIVDILKNLPESAFSNATVTPGGDGLIFLGKVDADTFAVSLPGLLGTLDPMVVKTNAATESPRTTLSTNRIRTSGTDLLARITQLLDEFCARHLPSAESAGKASESWVNGNLRAFLTSAVPGLDVQTEARVAAGRPFRTDFLLARNGERLIIELLPVSTRTNYAVAVAKVEHHMRIAGVKNGILLFLPDQACAMKRAETTVSGLNGRLVILSPIKQSA